MDQADASPYDSMLVVSFGGPESADDVMPFLENVVRGRNVPRARLLEVAEQYYQIGGVSPIYGQNRAFIAALEKLLAEHGPPLPVYFGNRNWRPYLVDTVRQMVADGRRRALAYVTSAYSSYSGCRQYRENIAEAQAAAGPSAPQIDKLRVFYNHPGFIKAASDRVRAALESIPAERRAATHIAFTAHSLPSSMAANCRYLAQLEETCRLVASGDLALPWRLVYQRRSGPPTQPWLEPDIRDHLAALAAGGVRDVIVAPIGFLSDHVEVLFDLDIGAREQATELGLNMVRAATVGTHPAMVAMVRELILERTNPDSPRRAVGNDGPYADVCAVDCCLPPSGHGK